MSKRANLSLLSLAIGAIGMTPALAQDGGNQVRARLYQSFPRTQSVRPAPKLAAKEPTAGSPAAAIKRAKEVEKSGDYARAIEILSSAIKSFPGNRELYSEHFDCCIHERRLQDALNDADAALAKGAPTAVVYRQRSTANYMLHDYASCVKDLDQLVKLGPLTANDYFNKANCYANLGDTKSTLDNLASGLKLDPKNADAYYLRAKTYKQLNQSALADADFKKAMSLQK